MVERRTFYSDGLKLVGYLRVPEGIRDGEKRSAVVLCGGFGAHQERFLPEMADYLSSQGYVTFTFDYRGFGESEGPRWRMIPQEQVKDIANAITFLEAQDVVNSAMIGLLGASFGGANVCYVAGVDTRVACVVSVVGVGCGGLDWSVAGVVWSVVGLVYGGGDLWWGWAMVGVVYMYDWGGLW